MPYRDPERRRVNNLRLKHANLTRNSTVALIRLAALTRTGVGAAAQDDVCWHPVILHGLAARGLAAPVGWDNLDLWRATPAGLAAADALARESADTNVLRARIAELEGIVEDREAELHATDAARLAALADADALLDELEGVVHHACADADGDLDSMAIGTLASAMRALADRGRIRVEFESGRRMIGQRIPREERTS